MQMVQGPMVKFVLRPGLLCATMRVEIGRFNKTASTVESLFPYMPRITYIHAFTLMPQSTVDKGKKKVHIHHGIGFASTWNGRVWTPSSNEAGPRRH